MAFENIKVISIVGQSPITVPDGWTVERTLQTLRIDIDGYDTQEEGEKLILSVRAGTKGARTSRTVGGAFAIPRFQILPDGRFAPVSPIDSEVVATFPTNADIAIIAKLFPEDDLFVTLTELPKLQEYYKAVVAYKEQLVEQGTTDLQSQLATHAREAVARIREDLGMVTLAASRVGKPWQQEASKALNDIADQLHVIRTSVEETIIDEEIRAQEDARRTALRSDALERIKAENPELDI